METYSVHMLSLGCTCDELVATPYEHRGLEATSCKWSVLHEDAWFTEATRGKDDLLRSNLYLVC